MFDYFVAPRIFQRLPCLRKISNALLLVSSLRFDFDSRVQLDPPDLMNPLDNGILSLPLPRCW